MRTDELFTGVAHAEKYHSGNWIARKLVNGFMTAVVLAVTEAGSRDVHEIGCGEGHILGLLAARGFKVRGGDISTASLDTARVESKKRGLDLQLAEKNIYELNAEDASDTVICCEVLEHLTDPAAGLRKLVEVAKKDLIVSVPREPVWRILNMMRGKYLTAWGNTPGHLQHWSPRQFVAFLSEHAEIVSVKLPLPWIVVHCRPKQK